MFEANDIVLSMRMQIIYYFSSSGTIMYNYLKEFQRKRIFDTYIGPGCKRVHLLRCALKEWV